MEKRVRGRSWRIIVLGVGHVRGRVRGMETCTSYGLIQIRKSILSAIYVGGILDVLTLAQWKP